MDRAGRIWRKALERRLDRFSSASVSRETGLMRDITGTVFYGYIRETDISHDVLLNEVLSTVLKFTH